MRKFIKTAMAALALGGAVTAAVPAQARDWGHDGWRGDRGWHGDRVGRGDRGWRGYGGPRGYYAPRYYGPRYYGPPPRYYSYSYGYGYDYPRYRYYGYDRGGDALLAGIAGLAIGAAIASH